MAETEPWSYTVRQHDGVATVVLVGELDMGCAEDLRQVLHDELHRAPVGGVLADLSGVGFLDSTILGVFVGVRQFAEEASRQFALIHPSPRVAKILTITGLNEVLFSPE